MFRVIHCLVALLTLSASTWLIRADEFAERPWLLNASAFQTSDKTVEEWLGLPGPAERWSRPPTAYADHSRLWVPRYPYFDVVRINYYRCGGWDRANAYLEGFSYTPTNRDGNAIMDMFFGDGLNEKFPSLFSSDENAPLQLATPLVLYRAENADNREDLDNFSSFAHQLRRHAELRDVKYHPRTNGFSRSAVPRQYRTLEDNQTARYLQSAQCNSSPDLNLTALRTRTTPDQVSTKLFAAEAKFPKPQASTESGSLRGRRLSIDNLAHSQLR